ncbi:ghrelin O-acyltransferase [Bombina bombina]|uniref:ghrelin O-acyltransferase n=1 Tax=Bombina bombina TaxID=8345 RepID=UPI00235AC449|nr:ghrelin O-acyltransferase [Bombina bombina]
MDPVAALCKFEDHAYELLEDHFSEMGRLFAQLLVKIDNLHGAKDGGDMQEATTATFSHSLPILDDPIPHQMTQALTRKSEFCSDSGNEKLLVRGRKPGLCYITIAPEKIEAAELSAHIPGRATLRKINHIADSGSLSYLQWAARKLPRGCHRVSLWDLCRLPSTLRSHFDSPMSHVCRTRERCPDARSGIGFIYLLAGGIILTCCSMGSYAILIFIPALGSILLFHTVGWQSVHRWAFLLQMAWQTGCHLWLLYKEYYLQETMGTRLSIVISSLMLLTQKITSLSLDIHESKLAYSTLVFLCYLLFFPALLGGPLCSFMKFHQQVNSTDMLKTSWPIWMITKGIVSAFLLQLLKALVSGSIQCTLMDCRQLKCIYYMWITALLFKLTYYSHWLLDETLFRAAGFEVESGQDAELRTNFSDTDIWILETTHRISVFTRTWNKSTAMWLRRLIFQRCKTHSLLMTFAFSAWWHGLYPGQIFGFLCWALMVMADYKIHRCLDCCPKSWLNKYLYKSFTWIQTQLIIAFIMMAVEARSFGIVWALCTSYNCFFPLLYLVSMVFLNKRT